MVAVPVTLPRSRRNARVGVGERGSSSQLTFDSNTTRPFYVPWQYSGTPFIRPNVTTLHRKHTQSKLGHLLSLKKIKLKKVFKK